MLASIQSINQASINPRIRAHQSINSIQSPINQVRAPWIDWLIDSKSVCMHAVLSVANSCIRTIDLLPFRVRRGRDGLMVLSDPFETDRSHVNTHPISLLRSPPYSGKTTLGQALRAHFLLQSDCESACISMASIHGRRELRNEKSFQIFWQKKVGFLWEELINFRRPT